MHFGQYNQKKLPLKFSQCLTLCWPLWGNGIFLCYVSSCHIILTQRDKYKYAYALQPQASSHHNSTAEQRGGNWSHSQWTERQQWCTVHEWLSSLSLAMRKSLPYPLSTLPDIYTYFTYTPPTHLSTYSISPTLNEHNRELRSVCTFLSHFMHLMLAECHSNEQIF